MSDWLDGTLYPDQPVPEKLETLSERIDFLVRLCGAWDFGILPDLETVEEVKRPEWCEAVEKANILTCVSYHLLRSYHHLPPAPFLGMKSKEILEDPCFHLI